MYEKISSPHRLGNITFGYHHKLLPFPTIYCKYGYANKAYPQLTLPVPTTPLLPNPLISVLGPLYHRMTAYYPDFPLNYII